MSAVFIHGPRGSGKTFHSKALAAFFQKTVIIEGLQVTPKSAPPHALVFTVRPASDTSIHIDDALKRAGISRSEFR